MANIRLNAENRGINQNSSKPSGLVNKNANQHMTFSQAYTSMLAFAALGFNPSAGS
jgi:hypothetical protein